MIGNNGTKKHFVIAAVIVGVAVLLLGGRALADTFGYTTTSSFADGNAYISYFKVQGTPASNGTANYITFNQVENSTGHSGHHLAVGIYTDNSGTPGTLIATSSAGSEGVLPTAYGVVSTTISFAVTAGTQYWVGIADRDAFSDSVGYDYDTSIANAFCYAGGAQSSFPSTAESCTLYSGAPYMVITYTAGSVPTSEQFGYRFRNDDGSESSATWDSSQNSTSTFPLNTNHRLRVGVNSSGTLSAAQYQLEYQKNGSGVWLVASSTATTIMPTFVASGTAAGGTGNVTVTMPSGIQPNDIAFLWVSSNNEPSSTAPAGWTYIGSVGSGSGISTSTAIDAFWIRATSTSLTNPVVIDRGNSTWAQAIVIRGSVTTGTPFVAYATTTNSTSNITTFSLTGPTTTSNNNLIVGLVADTYDNASARYSAWTNANLSSVTERADGGSTANNGVGGGAFTGGLATAGAVGTTTVTSAAASLSRNYSAFVIGVLPAAIPDIILSPSSNIAAGGTAATTAQLSAPTGKTTANFQAGKISDDTNPLPSLSLGADTYTELEWDLIATSSAATNDSFTFRVTAAGTALTTYSVTPAWTIGSAVAGPDATSASTTVNGDGARSGDVITITGTNFGTVSAANTATCNGGAGTGCIKFIVGGTDTVATSSISSWTNTSITFTVPSGLASNGGAGALQVWAANASDPTPLTFYIYPNITGYNSLALTSARVYNASDTDGTIMLIGDHFGSTTGTSTILGAAATLHNSTSPECTVAGFASTTACFEVPATIATNTYSGTIILNRASDNKQATTSLNILPRILSTNPASAGAGSVIQLLGDHLCQGGTCPVSPNRASATNNVKFGSATSSDSDFVAQTGGAGACNGAGAAWTDGEICVKVPSGAAGGSASTTVTSAGNASNLLSFTVLTPPPAPGTPTYTNVSTSTLTANWTSSAGATYYKLERATSSQTYAQIATTSALFYNDAGLSPGTGYWYRVRATNAVGDGSYSATSSVTTTAVNAAPNAPSQDAPASGAQDVLTSPVFRMTTTDSNGDSLQYKVTIYSNVGCSAIVQTNDESVSQIGWSGQNASSGAEYTSGTQGVFTAQTPLAANTAYYWKASAKDPEGSNTWTDSATCNGFTTTFGNWTTDSGSWSTNGSQLVVTPGSGSSVQLHVTGSSQANGIVEFEVKASAVGAGTGNVAGIAHVQAGGDRYLAGTADFLNQQSAIAKTISGAYTGIVSTPFTFSGNTFYKIRASLSGTGPTTLNSWINGGNTLSTTDSAGTLQSAGYIGLAASSTNGTAAFTIDDFASYSSTLITMSGLPAGGSWAVRDHSGAIVVACQTGSTLDLSTYGGQVPVDYDNGGGTVAVWAGNNNCPASPAPDYVYPSAGFATDLFGGDQYLYTPSGSVNPASVGGTIAATSTISVNSVGGVSY